MSNAEYDKILYQIMNRAGECVNYNFSDGDNEPCKIKKEVIFIGVARCI